MKELYILTGYDGFIGQTRKPWVSLDTPRFVEELKKLGYLPLVHEFHEVANGKVKIENSLVFYSFSHRQNQHDYIRDLLSYLETQGNTLIPSFQMFSCHENKGWQELHKSSLALHSLAALYFSSKRELKHYELKFPCVFKTLTGSNSTGVALVHSLADIYRQLAKHEPQPSLGKRLDFWRRKHLRKKKLFPGYPNYDLRKDALWYIDFSTPEIPFILQEYVPGLSCDYRVIVLGEKYFISKRHTRAGDFRASGAKLFDFELEAPEALLDKAAQLYKLFQSPFLSVDLGQDAQGKLYLFEYQAAHFGINAIVRGKGYYQREGESWRFTEAKPQFERFLAEALAFHLN